jgi:hypothetical protein
MMTAFINVHRAKNQSEVFVPTYSHSFAERPSLEEGPDFIEI